LYGVVCEMDHVILTVVKDILKGSGPKISFFTEKDLHILVYQNPNSDVELTVVNKKGPLNILLYYKTHVFLHLNRA